MICLLLCSISLFAQQSQDEQLALQYYKDKEYDKAIELFEKIHAKNPNSYIYYYYYSSLLSMERYTDAEKMVKKQVRNFPNVLRYKVDLGNVYELSGEQNKAEKQFQDLIKDLPAKESSVLELYNAFYARLKYDYAIETILKGRKILNNNYLLSKELFTMYQNLHQNSKIMEEVLSLIKEDKQEYLEPAETAIQNMLLDDEDQMAYGLAHTTLQKYSQKNPSNICCLSLLYWIYQLHKDYPSALLMAKAIDKRTKLEGIKTYELARTAADNKDYETSIEALNYKIGRALHHQQGGRCT